MATTTTRKKKKIFEFQNKYLKQANEAIKKYPFKRSAVMPLLHLVQEQSDGWIPEEAYGYISEMLDMPVMKIKEVAEFYTMYNTKKVGKYLIQVCRTTPCWLCNSEDILGVCKDYLEIDVGETTQDQLFTLIEVECLGACVNAPVVQINNDYYENLTKAKMLELLEKLKKKA